MSTVTHSHTPAPAPALKLGTSNTSTKPSGPTSIGHQNSHAMLRSSHTVRTKRFDNAKKSAPCEYGRVMMIWFKGRCSYRAIALSDRVHVTVQPPYVSRLNREPVFVHPVPGRTSPVYLSHHIHGARPGIPGRFSHHGTRRRRSGQPGGGRHGPVLAARPGRVLGRRAPALLLRLMTATAAAATSTSTARDAQVLHQALQAHVEVTADQFGLLGGPRGGRTGGRRRTAARRLQDVTEHVRTCGTRRRVSHPQSQSVTATQFVTVGQPTEPGQGHAGLCRTPSRPSHSDTTNS